MAAAPTPLHGPHRLAWTIGLVALAVAVGFLLGRLDVFGGSSSSSGTVEGSGVSASQTRALPPFSGVELAGSSVVAITVGGTQSVVVHADDNLIDRVTTRVSDGRLVIGTRGSFKTNASMRVDVTVSKLNLLELSGSGVVDAEKVRAQAFTVALPGSGVVRANGSVERLDISLPGSGDAQLDGLAARDVKADLPGSGRILVQATRSLDAGVSGSGSIVYTGNPPHVTTSVTGSGAITPR
jgi:Putative auto-transporter adhesin, head GIN domain